MISITDNENIPGLLLVIDFEKAFDSVSWLFIEKSLNFFNFPEGLIGWFRVLYHKPTSCVSFNGQYSAWFNLQRGCRQGDPISPYLYLICAEILSLMIRTNNKIKGIKIKNKEILLSLFADDTTLYLDGSEQSFNEAIRTIELFSSMSGLKMNNDKTQIAWIGSRKNSNVKFMRDKNFIWDPGTFKVLGVLFSTSEEIVKINYENKLEEIKREIARWKKRHMTPLGKITIIKTLIISKLTYLFINIPDPPQTFLKELDNILLRFLWGGKTNRIKKTTICKSYEEGGLRMIDIYSFLASLKIGWIKRLTEACHKVSAWYHIYPILHSLDIFGFDYIRICNEQLKNPFWLDVLKHYRKLHFTRHDENVKSDYLRDEPIHYNDMIKRENKTIFIREWILKGILKVGDLLLEDDEFMNYNTFKEKYDVPHTNFMLYAGIVRAVKRYYVNNAKDIHNIKRLTSKELWYCIRAGNKYITTKLLDDRVLPTSTFKWNMEFRDVKWKEVFKKCFITSSDPQLQWFQARVLHRILPTQKYLTLCRITDSSLCAFCNQEIETIEHLLWECVYVLDFWKELAKLIQEKCTHCVRLTFNKELILFGSSKQIMTDKPLDFIILYAKFFIYTCKFDKEKPIVNTYIKKLQYRYNIERSLALKVNKENGFFRNWQIYNGIIENMNA